MGHPRSLFLYFSSFQYTIDSKQMFIINNFLSMTGFEPRTSGIGSDRSSNCPMIKNFYSFDTKESVLAPQKTTKYSKLCLRPLFQFVSKTVSSYLAI